MTALTATATTELNAWAQLATGAYSPSTLRAWKRDTQAWADWCTRRGVSALPAAPADVAAWVAELGARLSPATCRRYVSSVARVHTAAGLPSPTQAEPVRLALRAVARAKGTGQRQAAGLTQRDADRVAASLGPRPGLRDARNLALLLLARDVLARGAELVALDVEHLELTDKGGLVHLLRTKTSTERQPCFIGPETADALRAWLSQAGVTQGPVFRAVGRGGRVGGRLGTRDVRRVLRELAERAHLPHAAQVSGHSPRVGMTQDLVAGGADVAGVMQAGGWRTATMVSRYTRKLSAERGAVAQFHAARGAKA